MMSEKFSVEDILNEVKQMDSDTYVSGKSDSAQAVKEDSFKPHPAPQEIKVEEEKVVAQEAPEKSFSDEFKPVEKKKEKSGFSFSDISKDEFFRMIEENSVKDKKEEPVIEDGFKIVNDRPEKVEEKTENEAVADKDLVETPKNVNSVENSVENVEDSAKKADEKAENLEKTAVFDKKDLETALEEKKTEKTEEKEEKVEQPEKRDFEDVEKEVNDLFASLTGKREHTPSHLLSVDEINSGKMGASKSLRFNEKVVNLTKNGRKNSDYKDKFAGFQKPQDIVEEIPETDVVAKPSELPKENETVEKSVGTDIEATQLFETLSKKYSEKEIQKNQPDVLNSEIETDDEVVEIPAQSVEYEKIEESIELDEPVISTSDNRFSRKMSRRIEERGFDYSEEAEDEEEVVDDYTSIDDEEPVREDLDLSLRKVSKRLGLTIVAFVVGFIVTALPSSTGFSLFNFISPESNLTGFMIANAIILGFTLLVNISDFFRGIASLVTFKPDTDSPLSVAGLFVVAQAVIAFIPEFSATAGDLPFFTAALQFGYILILMGKKSMNLRIKQNFRLIANTAVKQSCFVADERFCEMLEKEDFIGTPYVAASKSVLNLHNYLKNSYCEDPSDNLSKLFAPISLIASIITFVFTYFISKDVVSSLFYATAVSIAAAPVSALLSVHSPLKKAALQFRQRDGLISGYEAVNEFSDVDCVAINAEELFPAGSVEMMTLRAIGDVSIEDIILKSAALTVSAGGPLADVFDKIIDGRRKMLSPVSDIVYEDGLGLTGKIDGKIVRIGNRQFIDSYGIYGLSDSELEEKANKNGCFIVYSAIEDEVCGMFVLKYKSIDPDIEDAVYDLVSNGITIAVKTNDPNITPALVAKVFEIPEEYVSIMEAHTAEYFDEITRPAKNGNSIISFGGSSTVFASLVVACKKLKSKISVAVLIQAILTIFGFALCMFVAVSGKGFENINAQNIIAYQLVSAVLSIFIPSLIKRIK